MTNKSIALELRSAPEDSSVLSSKLVEFLDETFIPERARYDVMISCDEVFSNLYMHAYEKNPEGQIHFNAELGKDCITITFTDHGKSMPGDQPLTLTLDKYIEVGYLLFIIYELMDEVRYYSNGTANTITLKKRIEGCGK
jgi:anti-sigma regulatory factor (Ser/Thr protein kinase)